MIDRKITVLIADDHQLLREGLSKLVEKSFPESSIGLAENGKEALKKLSDSPYDIILLDLDMPVMDGFDASIEIVKKFPKTKILVISGFTDEKYIFHLVEIGVHGFTSKNASLESLKEAIQQVMQKGFYYSDEMVQIMRKGIINNSTKPAFRANADLTKREVTVLKLMCHEMTARQIADAVHLSERTVEKIRASLANKLDVKGTAGLVRYAVKNGLDY